MDQISSQTQNLSLNATSSGERTTRLLSLDGGGVRGISSLLILEHIMEKIRQKEGLDHVPKPCNRFDMIGGTDTGG